MIALLRGTVDSRGVQHIVLDTGGVGYLVHCPAPLASALPADQPVTVHVATLVREDAITLYGFGVPADRDAFNTLRAVNGIGPKNALAVLSHLGVDVLVHAIESDDLRALTQVPGVGRKTASRMCLELKGKLTPSFAAAPAVPVRVDDPLPLALARLDYKKSEIDRALASEDVPSPDRASIADRLRAAIGVLSRLP